MPNSFIENQINNSNLGTTLETNSEYITDNIINNSSFTEAKIILNPKIFNNLDEYDEITIENIIVAKNKLINTLTKTNKNLINIIVNCSRETIDINNYIEDLSKKISDNKTLLECKTLLKQETSEHEYLKTGYDYLTKEYITLKKTYNGLNRIYVDNIINHFNEEQKIETLKAENTKLKSLFLCRICFTNTINIILNPCGHVAICKTCIEGIIEHDTGSSPQCPLCNNCIERYDNIFIPI